MSATDDLLLRSVAQHAEEEFRQLHAREFTYTADHGSLLPSTTKRRLSLGAVTRTPQRQGKLQDLQAPYRFATVATPRIRPQRA